MSQIDTLERTIQNQNKELSAKLIDLERRNKETIQQLNKDHHGEVTKLQAEIAHLHGQKANSEQRLVKGAEEMRQRMQHVIDAHEVTIKNLQSSQ